MPAVRGVSIVSMQGRKNKRRLDLVAGWSLGMQEVLSLLGLWTGSPVEHLAAMQRLALVRYDLVF